MPLPKLPTRMGAMVSATPDTAIPEAPEIKTPATRPAKPAAKRQASVTPAAKVLTPPVPEPPVLSVVATRTGKKSRLSIAKRKLFVLDTNVLLHDSNYLFKFEEHDIFLPMMVLEALDRSEKRRLGKECVSTG